MKKIVYYQMLISFLLILSGAVMAKPMTKNKLNHVIFKVSQQEWVKTELPKVKITIDAAASEEDLANVRGQIMSNLSKIAGATWHITKFMPRQDNTGLKRLTVMAEGRLTQKDLVNIYKKAQNVSKPGSNYKITSISFTPSDSSLEAAKLKIRGLIYQQVEQEVASLNKQFPKQNYSVFKIDFLGLQNSSMPVRAYGQNKPYNINTTSFISEVIVNNLVKLTAVVDLASNRDIASD